MKDDLKKNAAQAGCERISTPLGACGIDAHTLFDLAPLPYQSLDDKGRILDVNTPWTELFGRTREEVVGQYFGNFLTLKSESLLQKRFARFLAKGETRQVEFTIIRPDGARLLVEVNGKIAYDEQGNFLQTHCILTDITEKRRAENALQESETRFRNLFEKNIDGIIYTNLDATIVDVNSAFCNILQSSQDDLLGKSLYDLMPEEWHDINAKIFKNQVLTKGWSEEYRKEYISPRGHRVPVLVRVWLNRGVKGNPVGAWGIVKDVTQTLHTEAALEKSEDRYRRVMQSANEGLLGMDVDHRIVITNPAIAELLGYPQHELIGKPFFDLVREQDHKDQIERFMRPEVGQKEQYERQLLCKDGSEICASLSGSPIFSSEGEYTGYFTMVTDHTDRKKAESALRLTQFSVDNAPVDIYWLNQDGRVVYANEQACVSRGYTKEEMLQLRVSDFNPAFPKEGWADYWKTHQKMDFNRFESSHMRKDGSIFPVTIVSHYQFQEGQEYLFTYAFDMTEKERTNRELQRNQTLLNEVQRISQTGGWEIDTMSGQFIWTEGQYRLLGLAQNERPRRAIEYLDEFVHPEDRTVLGRAMYRILNEKIPVEAEYRAIRANGEEVVFLTKGIPDLDSAGNVQRVYGSTLDVTRERKAAEELKLAHIRLLTILDGIDATIYVSTIGTNDILFMNAHMREQFGVPDKAQKCHLLFRGENEQCSFCPKPGLLNEDGTPVKTIVTERHNPVLDRWFLNHDRAIEWLEGEMVHMHMAADITELKAMEQELVGAMAEAEAAGIAKNEFLANMSHEIRTPLNGLLGMLQLLQMTKLVDEQRDYLDTAMNSGRNLLRILNDILDLSKIESGKLEFDEHDMELTEVLDSVTSVFRYQAESRGIDISWKIDESRPRYFMVDKGRLRQILFNLVGNSTKFTESGSITVEAYPLKRLAADGKTILFFSVSDTGIGIPDNKVTPVFDPFTQVDGSSTRKYQGTGLGLGIVRRLVTLMGGNISITSEEGKGTVIAFTIRVNPADSCRVKGGFECVDSERQEIKILVAEDERINRQVIQRLLAKMGHNAHCVEDGQRAIDVLKERHFDCLLTDIQMPVMDGLKATRIIREDLKLDIPIIALTAHAMKGDRKRFLDAGMNGYISKPFEMAELQQELHRVILAAQS